MNNDFFLCFVFRERGQNCFGLVVIGGGQRSILGDVEKKNKESRKESI